MTAGRLAALYLAALAGPAGEATGLGWLRGSSAALALLPWTCFATMPRRGGSTDLPGSMVPLFALPPLALGTGLDLARGADWRTLGPAVAASWLALWLWNGAAQAAARPGGRARLHAALWLLLVPLGLALRVALAWIPGSSLEALPPRPWHAADPLLFLHRWGRPDGDAQVPWGEGAFLLGAAGLVYLSCRPVGSTDVESAQ